MHIDIMLHNSLKKTNIHINIHAKNLEIEDFTSKELHIT